MYSLAVCMKFASKSIEWMNEWIETMCIGTAQCFRLQHWITWADTLETCPLCDSIIHRRHIPQKSQKRKFLTASIFCDFTCYVYYKKQNSKGLIQNWDKTLALGKLVVFQCANKNVAFSNMNFWCHVINVKNAYKRLRFAINIWNERVIIIISVNQHSHN